MEKVLKGPQLDLTEDGGIYERFLTWKEDCELYIKCALVKDTEESQASYIQLWSGEVGKRHLRSELASGKLTKEDLGKPEKVIEALEKFCKPKAQDLVTARKLRDLRQGTQSLQEYIDQLRLIVSQMNYNSLRADTPDATIKNLLNRIQRDAFCNGLKSEETYTKLIKEGNTLTFENAVQIALSDDSSEKQATQSRDSSTVHKLNKKKDNKHQQKQKPATTQNQQQKQSGGSGNTTKTCGYCLGPKKHPKHECPARDSKCWSCGKIGHYQHACRASATKKAAFAHSLQSATNQPPQVPMQPQMPQIPQMATATEQPFMMQQMPGPQYLKKLRTVRVNALLRPNRGEHIKPLWVSISPQSEVNQIDAEIDTGSDITIMPLYKVKALYGNIQLSPPNYNITAYNDKIVPNLGSFTQHVHTRKGVKVLQTEVTDTTGYLILGREHALELNYVQFPDVEPPRVNSKQERTYQEAAVGVKALKETKDPRSATQLSPPSELQIDPVPVTAHRPSKDRLVIGNKAYKLPTTKEYLLKEFADVFAAGVGALPGPEYHIELKDDYIPVQHPPRQVPISMRDAYREKLTELVQQGIVAPVTEHTEWINSIVPVKKPDGSLRLCLDPKDLNRAIKRSQHYSRTVEDVVSDIEHSEYFTLGDANSGYWHVPIDLKSSMLTTFNTPWGKFRWLKLPFGLKVSSDVFQERLDRVLALMPDGVSGIADDVLIHGKTREDHDARVIQLLELARKNGLRLSAKKLQFASQDCKFFGHRLTKEGLKADPDKVSAITNMTPPTNIQEMQSFLGMINYLNRYCPNLSELTEPLRMLCKQEVPYQWQAEQNKAFEEIKSAITQAPVLAYFKPELPIVIQSDASNSGIGSVLLQAGQPVLFNSRSLTETEKNYSPIEKELLGLVEALKKLHKYTAGYEIEIQTDHKPLVSIWKKSVSNTSPRLRRLHLELSHYAGDATVTYIKGKDNVIADALSRVGHRLDPDPDPELQVTVHALTTNFPASEECMDDWKNSTMNDPVLSKLMNIIQAGWPEKRGNLPKELQEFWNYRDELAVEKGLIFKVDRLLVPAKNRPRVLEQLHQGHFGEERTILHAREAVFWPGITKDIREMVRTCLTCNTHRNSQQKEPLQPHPVPEGPWQKIGLDLFQFEGKQHLMVVDYFSRFILVRQLNSITAKNVISELTKIFHEHGIPRAVMSDSGTQFTSQEFKTFAAEYDFQHYTSSPMHHQSNGLAERMIQTVKNTWTKCLHSGQDLQKALLMYRSTPLGNNLPSPAELLNSRKFRSFIPSRTNQLSELQQVSRDEMLKQKERECQQYNQTARPLRPLHLQQEVFVQLDPMKNIWVRAVVTAIPSVSEPDYQVLTRAGGLYRRNRVYIIPDHSARIVAPNVSAPIQPTMSTTSMQPTVLIPPVPQMQPAAAPAMPPSAPQVGSSTPSAVPHVGSSSTPAQSPPSSVSTGNTGIPGPVLRRSSRTSRPPDRLVMKM